MKRSLIIFAVFLVVVLGLGFVIFKWVVMKKQPAGSLGTGPADSRSRPGTRPPLKSAVDAGPAAEELPKGVLIEKIEGVARYRGPDQEWIVLSVGDRLMETQSVRTDSGSRVQLKVDSKSTIRLSERGELTVDRISTRTYSFSLKRGRISVDHNPPRPRALQVRAEKSQTVAETKAGKFAIMNTSGIVSVATNKGKVKLTARKKTVTVRAGQQSVVTPGDAPRPPTPIPVSVLLQVADPGRRILKRPFVVVRGRVSVGAEVLINNIPATTDARGHFRVRIPLREGKNRLTAVTRTVTGQEQTRNLGTIVVKTPARARDIKVRWD